MTEIAISSITEAQDTQAQGPEPALVVQDAVKRFRKRTVLDGVSFEVAPGERVGLGGANGAGKTTLLRLASGFFAPDEGFVTVFGLSHERDRRKCQMRVGFLGAGDRGLYARLTVTDHLDLWARMALLPIRHRGRAVARGLERFGLDDLADRRVDRLSMGQRQRVRLAMTFLHEPMLVLLDEPLTSLDRPGASLLGQALAELAQRGGSLVWCSPDPTIEDVELDRTYVIEGGGLRPT